MRERQDDEPGGTKSLFRFFFKRNTAYDIPKRDWSSDVCSSDLYTGSPSAQSADTVAVDEVQGLELAAAKTTHGELPSESFLDRVLEPVVIIGATGVSIYLFFHVRS